MAICYIGLGSNLGRRRKNIKEALRMIGKFKGTKVIKTASIIETEPCGGPKGQNKFLNSAAKISTRLLPEELLRELKKTEKKIGRHETVRWGPRVIDLDILLYADRLIHTERLTVPHRRMLSRGFVICPLLEIL